MATVKDNLSYVRERIEKAARRVGRDPADVMLVAVSKRIDLQKIEEVVSAGASVLGENYVQEAKQKIEKLGRQVQWHMIGHLQTNKVKLAVNLFDMIETVDRIEVAREINKRGIELGKKISALIQVNISQESTKSGIEKERVVSLASEISGLTHIKVKGLMTMPPYFTDPEETRPYFKSLRELRDEIERERLQHISMEELSMGMSHDFETAIEEGATIVRVGTAIFGERRG